jgi:hypothetical protein
VSTLDEESKHDLQVMYMLRVSCKQKMDRKASPNGSDKFVGAQRLGEPH